MSALFRNRQQAGIALARRLAELKLDNPVVLALPRGSVPVAIEVARTLRRRSTCCWCARSARRCSRSWQWRRSSTARSTTS